MEREYPADIRDLARVRDDRFEIDRHHSYYLNSIPNSKLWLSTLETFGQHPVTILAPSSDRQL